MTWNSPRVLLRLLGLAVLARWYRETPPADRMAWHVVMCVAAAALVFFLFDAILGRRRSRPS